MNHVTAAVPRAGQADSPKRMGLFERCLSVWVVLCMSVRGVCDRTRHWFAPPIAAH